MSDLTWGSITICDRTTGITAGGIAWKDNYFVQSYAPGDGLWRDVYFPNTTGRLLKKIGQANTQETSRRILIASSGDARCLIYKATFSALVTHIAAIETARKATSTAIATLVCYYGTFTNMRLDSFAVSAPMRFTPSGLFAVEFAAEFSEYGS